MPSSITNETLPQLITSFFAYLKGVRDDSDATIKSYAHDIDTYLKYIDSRPESEKTSDEFVINEHTMRGFSTFLRERKNVNSTVQRRLDGVSSFWKYLYLEHNFNKPLSARDCGIRLKNKRNPTNSIPRKEYHKFMEAVNVDLRKIQ